MKPSPDTPPGSTRARKRHDTGLPRRKARFLSPAQALARTAAALALAMAMACLATATAAPRRGNDRLTLLRRVWSYAASIDTIGAPEVSTYAYRKFYMHVNKRNALLLPVPTMYTVAHGRERMFAGETFYHVVFSKPGNYTATPMLTTSTVPRHRQAMAVMLNYVNPEIYNQTLLKDFVLSPLCKYNRGYYKYRVRFGFDGYTEVTFEPRTRNTQLVSGRAIVETLTGRVTEARMKGEYDMISFEIDMDMGESGMASLMPKTLLMRSKFNFLGNDITCRVRADYFLPTPADSAFLPTPADSAGHTDDWKRMETLRPAPLQPDEQEVYHRFIAQQDKRAPAAENENKEEKADNMLKTILWDYIGDNIVNRIKGNFGSEDQGYFRINPILNPLYLGYTKRKGLTYKFDVRGSYRFGDNSDISLRVKLGYAFKQRQLYYTIPLTYMFDRKHNAYVEMELGNGNRITNSQVLDRVKEERSDTIDWDAMNLDYFRDFKWKANAHYDFSPHWGVEAGLVVHKRTAVDKASFHAAGLRDTYRSTAPMLELEWRPWGWRGPIITADYERGVKGILRSNTDYERWEFDGQYMHKRPSLQTISLRAGAGFYTTRSHGTYFLDYTNFRENNIIGGWNDDWSGEFELLNSNWYNASSYYVRGNATYESPILLTAWIPLLGHYVEKERVYLSCLNVIHLHPYVEMGYGVSTRLFSMGIFASFKNGDPDGIGCKFGFELFRQW